MGRLHGELGRGAAMADQGGGHSEKPRTDLGECGRGEGSVSRARGETLWADCNNNNQQQKQQEQQQQHQPEQQ